MNNIDPHSAGTSVKSGTRAVFLSYASEDARAAERICITLRLAGIEVWFDRSDLRGGDAWDNAIRRQIKNCALFIPLIPTRAPRAILGWNGSSLSIAPTSWRRTARFWSRWSSMIRRTPTTGYRIGSANYNGCACRTARRRPSLCNTY